MTTRDEYINGLRQLADWLHRHPDVAVPYSKYISLPLSTNARVEEFAAAAGVEVVTDAEGNTQATLHFGPIEYYAYGYADFSSFSEQLNEDRAREWAERNDLTLQPREGCDQS